MFNSVKEKLYSVVQEGLDLNMVRKKIYLVQEQTRFSSKASMFQDIPFAHINLNTGADLLSKYQMQWKAMHEDAEQNSNTAEQIDRIMLQIHTSVKGQLDNFVQINTILGTLPQVTSLVDDCISQVKELAVMFEIAETEMIDLEDLIERTDFKRRQLEHTFQLTMYKERKLEELGKNHVSLMTQQAGLVKVAEQQQREALRERQRAAHYAFLKDITLYKTKGTLPKKSDDTSKSAMQTTLEEIQLDSQDNTDLDEFLNK
ncbi:dystrobrevin binding protein dysbindin [Arctopsyche grandis]|uniref:dystrobrevin binding protein dysbindin n=1 Tax=Arctopsyche grandis TaxID=121162 RepID=UPI00406D7FEC